MVFHCLNRGNDGGSLFADAGDYAAFERIRKGDKYLFIAPDQKRG
jgi:hypothetical protein